MSPIRPRTKPVRDRGRGTFLIDRIFRIEGQERRLKRASGTLDPKLWRSYNEMLDRFYDAGRVDVIQQLIRGDLSFRDAWTHYSRGQWAAIPEAEHLAPFKPAFDRWIKTYPKSEKHRASMRASFAALANLAEKGAQIKRLPGLCMEHRGVCEKAGHGRSFNLTKAHVQAFLKDRFGRSDPVYRAVLDIEKLATPAKFARHPLTVAKARELAASLSEAARPIWWMLCCTGMNPKEAWGRWEAEGFALRIHGTKRAGRNRLVPLICTPVRPTLTAWGFRQALRRRGVVTPYDGRRTYANWLEAAGIPRTRRRLYLGHGVKDVTDLYERHEVAEFIAEDRDKLLAFIGEEASAGVRAVP